MAYIYIYTDSVNALSEELSRNSKHSLKPSFEISLRNLLTKFLWVCVLFMCLCVRVLLVSNGCFFILIYTFIKPRFAQIRFSEHEDCFDSQVAINRNLSYMYIRCLTCINPQPLALSMGYAGLLWTSLSQPLLL
jgi:hypothetical protein